MRCAVRVARLQVGYDCELLLVFDCPDDVMLQRLRARGHGRADDNEETIRKRLQVRCMCGRTCVLGAETAPAWAPTVFLCPCLRTGSCSCRCMLRIAHQRGRDHACARECECVCVWGGHGGWQPCM
jgi:hypothetical protein